MKNKGFPQLVLLSFGMVGASASGAVIIDDFSDSANPSGTTTLSLSGGLVANNAVPISTSTTGSGLSGVIGGERIFSLTRSFATGSGSRRVEGTISDAAPAFFEYESSTGANGFAEFQYGATSPLNADLSAESAFRIVFDGYDAPSSNPLVTTITVASGGGTNSLVQNLPGTSGGGNLDFSFASFPGVDFSDVDTIFVRFDPNQGGDFEISSISAIGSISPTLPVPEPSGGMTLLGLLLSGALIRRRK